MTTVSASFTSRAFAEVRIGWNRLSVAVMRSATRAGVACMRVLRSEGHARSDLVGSEDAEGGMTAQAAVERCRHFAPGVRIALTDDVVRKVGRSGDVVSQRTGDGLRAPTCSSSRVRGRSRHPSLPY